MIGKKSILAVVLARGGSKGIPRKNIKSLGGKPLLAWTIEQAMQSAYVDRVILSSDDEEIMEVARRLGCEVPFRRPAELATDTASSMDCLLHAVDSIDSQYDYCVLLQPTSPFRTYTDIDECIRAVYERGSPACVTVTVVDKSPYWMFTCGPNGELSPLLGEENLNKRRQDLPVVYALNGAVYVAEIDWLRNSRSFVSSQTAIVAMPKERALDIDVPYDFDIAEFLMAKLSAASCATDVCPGCAATS